jgi:hypothetical protein
MGYRGVIAAQSGYILHGIPIASSNLYYTVLLRIG